MPTHQQLKPFHVTATTRLQAHEPNSEGIPLVKQVPPILKSSFSGKRKSVRKNAVISSFEPEDVKVKVQETKRRRKGIYLLHLKANEQNAVATESLKQDGGSQKPDFSSDSNHFLREEEQIQDESRHQLILGTQAGQKHARRGGDEYNLGQKTDQTPRLMFPFNKRENELDDFEKDTMKMFPIPFLWDKAKAQPGPRFANIADLINFLRTDTNCVFYIGQESVNCKDVIYRCLSVPKYHKAMDVCMNRTGIDQRIPILNPKRALKLDPPDEWPRIIEYQDYILREHQKVLEAMNDDGCYRLSSRKRTFCAGETCTLGIGVQRTRFFTMNKKEGTRARSKRGKTRGAPKFKIGKNSKEERTREDRRQPLQGTNGEFERDPKPIIHSQKSSTEPSLRPKRKRRPNVLYLDSLAEQSFLEIGSDNEGTMEQTISSPSAHSKQSVPSDKVPSENPRRMAHSLTDGFLGADSIEDDVETPDYLLKVSQFIDYVPYENPSASPTPSSLSEHEPRQNYTEDSHIVDKLDGLDVEDSKDPLFAEVDDNLLRMLDDKASGELLTKRVLEEHAFEPDAHLFENNVRKPNAQVQQCSSEFPTDGLQPDQPQKSDSLDRVKVDDGERNRIPEKNSNDTFALPNNSRLLCSSPGKQSHCSSDRKLSEVKENLAKARKHNTSTIEELQPICRAVQDEQNFVESHTDPEKESAATQGQCNESNVMSSRSVPCSNICTEMPSIEGGNPGSDVGTTKSPLQCHKDPDVLQTEKMARNWSKDLVIEHSESKQVRNRPSIIQDVSEDINSDACCANAPETFGAIRENNSSSCDSIYVYLWDHKNSFRTERVIPLQIAITKCMESDRFSIYDGQDYDFGDWKSSVLTGMTEKDIAGWRSRKMQTGKIRKVRVWNSGTGGLRTHYRSPAVQRLVGWLESNPENVIFSPSMVLPSTLTEVCKEREKNVSTNRENIPFARKKSFVDLVKVLVLQRIRYLRILEIPKNNLNTLELWNTRRKRIELRRSFASHSKLTRFLFANPWFEPLFGQDDLFELERSTLYKLIRVRPCVDASVATYWDSVNHKVYTYKKETDESRTIGEFLTSNSKYALYRGQDTAYFRSLVTYTAASRSSRCPVLVRCGAGIQKVFFARQWVTAVVDPSLCSTACAVFWNKETKTVHMQPKMCSFTSINSYIEECTNMELYAGQDQPAYIQKEILDWMELIKKCCMQGSGSVVLLTRLEFAPLKHNAVAWPDFLNDCGMKSVNSRKGTRSPVTNLQHENQKSQAKGNVINANAPLDHNTAISTKAREQEVLVPNMYDDKYNNRYLELMDDHIKKASIRNFHDSITQPIDETIVLEPSVCTSIGSDELFSEDGIMCSELEEVSQTFEESLRAPARAAARLLSAIKEIGPRVLKQELVHDLRHTLYENTTMEVGSISQLFNLLQQNNNLHFVRMAAELCKTLESLDVSSCFTGNTDIGYGASDILSVREDLESGKIFMMSDVIKRFRIVCQNLVHLNEGFYLELEAKDLMDHGEAVIEWYMKENEEVFARETKIRRLAKICEKARQIGFRKQRNRSTSNMQAAAGSKGHDVTIRASGGHARVTFLNYRDEKGNSVMGKRTSVRVFGLPIDTRACQRHAGGARPCHICGHEVFEADETSLTCGNRSFGDCSECVCRQCLESVTCMELSEFISFRNGQEWICVHCRGLCPAGSECLQDQRERTKPSEQLETIRFVWPHKLHGHPTSVLVSLLRRRRNGDFDDNPEQGITVSLSQSPYGMWSTVTDCRIGAYRAFIKADGKWVASTTFCVFSSASSSVSTAQSNVKREVRTTYFACQDRPKMSAIRRKPRVHWTIAERVTSGPVHAIRRSDSDDVNKVIEECSRTEGYDWQRAKRHNVVHWRPVVQKADPLEVDRGKSKSTHGRRKSHLLASKTQAVRLTFSGKDHSSWKTSGAAFPKPRPGLTYGQLCNEWNTFKYDEMMKLLWGIVTGRSAIHGIGLFTLTGYRKGNFIIEYTGDLIRTPLADIREARYEAAGLGTYLFKINEQEIVDATVQSNRARFTNHSCDPNMIAIIVHVRGRNLVALQATRDIPKFAELTFDYKLPIEDKKVQCLCNAWNCVGVMN